VGFDGGKKVNGRKRHILVDTLGLVLMVVVTAASCPEREGARKLLVQFQETCFARGESKAHPK
jgi:IS5 family transposase